jgi:putative transposase
MNGKRYSEEQIIYALKAAEGGQKAAHVCRELGVTEVTFYRWKKQYAGMGITELRKLKLLEEENRKLKSLVADLSLDKHILQEVISKKV